MRSPQQRIEQKKVQEVASLLIPLSGQQLLVPNVTVAEIVPVPTITAIENTPDWYIGDCLWREQRIPVVFFEMLNGEARPDILPTGRLAVLNSTGVHDDLPFIALMTRGLPRLARVNEEEITSRDQDERKALDLLAVSWAGEDAVIPDIQALEKSVLEYWLEDQD